MNQELEDLKKELSIYRFALNKAAFLLHSYATGYKHKDVDTIVKELLQCSK